MTVCYRVLAAEPGRGSQTVRRPADHDPVQVPTDARRQLVMFVRPSVFAASFYNSILPTGALATGQSPLRTIIIRRTEIAREHFISRQSAQIPLNL